MPIRRTATISENVARPPATLGRLFWIFLKIGCTAWGGFMPFIAVVQNYLTRNAMLDESEISDAIFVATILPGPVAVNFTAGIGYRLRGIAGAAVCWSGALLPTFVFVVILSAAYFAYGALPAVGRIFNGILPAVIAIVISAAWAMAQKNVRTPAAAVIALGALAIVLLFDFVHRLSAYAMYATLGIVLVAGIAGYALNRPGGAQPAASAPPRPNVSGSGRLAVAPLPLSWLFAASAPLTWKLFFSFAIMSVTLFGGGYVFIPIIKGLVVDSLHWVTLHEYYDGIAIGQVTPGPIMITAAFIGYRVEGLLGAFAATLGMFGPPAILMVVAVHYLTVWKRWPWVTAALKGVRPAVVGMLFAAAFVVAKTSQWGWAEGLILVAALIAILRYQAEVAIVIPLAGAAGFVLTR